MIKNGVGVSFHWHKYNHWALHHLHKPSLSVVFGPPSSLRLKHSSIHTSHQQCWHDSSNPLQVEEGGKKKNAQRNVCSFRTNCWMFTLWWVTSHKFWHRGFRLTHRRYFWYRNEFPKPCEWALLPYESSAASETALVQQDWTAFIYIFNVSLGSLKSWIWGLSVSKMAINPCDRIQEGLASCLLSLK